MTKAQLDVLSNVSYCVATENADPVWGMHEPISGQPTYTTPDGVEFSLAPMLDLGLFEAFMAVQQALEDQFYAATTDTDTDD